MNEIEETPTAFRQFLTDKPERSIVGIAIKHHECPLAHYLAEKTRKIWGVTEDAYYPGAGEGSSCEDQPLPIWAFNFVRDVDRPHYTANEPISREEALDALDAACYGLEETNEEEEGRNP